MISKQLKTKTINLLWEIWCMVSVVGIWPRFIEPNLLGVKNLTLPVADLPKELEGFKIVHFSDLHLHSGVTNYFLNKCIRKITHLQPDLIAFTGDFICKSQLSNPERLKQFLNKLSAPFGCFAVFGNHDYNSYLSINGAGEYDVANPGGSTIQSGIKLLFKKREVKGFVTEAAREVTTHTALLDLLAETPFQVLHNETVTVPVGKTKLNITGLGELMGEKLLPEQAFKNYDQQFPGIVLMHNPDGSSHLKNCPGEIILSGHTHAGQVNLPFLTNQFIILENNKLKYGLKEVNGKPIFITRGVGSVLPFRWFATPEIVSITLEKK